MYQSCNRKHESERIKSVQYKKRSGIPDYIKSGHKHPPCYPEPDVRTYCNSPEPVQLNAYACTQERNIYLASDQKYHTRYKKKNNRNSNNIQRMVITSGLMKNKKEDTAIRMGLDSALVNTLWGENEKIKLADGMNRDRGHIDDDKSLSKTSSLSTVVDTEEPVVLIGHGSMPRRIFRYPIDSQFEGISAERMAEIIGNLLPDNYKGRIYINACYSGAQRDMTEKGSSYIERLGKALNQYGKKNKKTFGTFEVIGNVGAASSAEMTTETQNIEKKYGDAIVKKYGTGIGDLKYNDKTKMYKCSGSLGIARWSDGLYSSPLSQLLMNIT